MRKHFILLASSLIVTLSACSKSETPQAPKGAPQANTAAPGPATQPSQPATIANAEANKGKIDACALLTSKEIQSVQSEPLKETKPSGKSEGGFAVSQCYFTLPTFTNSISLTVMQRGDGTGARDPKQFWKETFHREKDSEKAAHDKDKNNKGSEEEEEKSAPPEKIAGLGDEAFWSGNRVGGALYVLKGNSYIRISVGGAGDQATKIKKSKALAQMVLKHL
jgi:hypothetical protein